MDQKTVLILLNIFCAGAISTSCASIGVSGENNNCSENASDKNQIGTKEKREFIDKIGSFLKKNRGALSAAGAATFTDTQGINGAKIKNTQKKDAFVARSELFEAVTGVDEETFRKNENDEIRRCIQKDKSGNFYIVNLKTGKKTSAGRFEELSIKEMDEKIAKMNFPGGGTFNAISIGKKYGYATHELRKKVEVGNMQSLEENAGAAFAAASNFNVLETLGIHDDVSQKKIANYLHDHTQGPYASLSAIAGAIKRMYGIFYDENKKPEEWKQTTERQINLLDKLNIKTKNGYIVEDVDSLYAKIINDNLNKNYKIGYHSNVQVSGGYCESAFKQRLIEDDKQVIDQIYLAALNMYDFSEKDLVKARLIAKKIIKLNYEGLLKSAFLHGKKKVILPLLGCGVFGNNPEWHIEAIKENLEFIKRSGMQVTLNLFDMDANSKHKGFCKKIKELVLQSGGEYQIF